MRNVLLCWALVFAAAFPRPTSESTLPPQTWLETVTAVITGYLCKNDEMGKLKPEDIRKEVEWAWNASRWNPSWGPRRLCTLKLLSAKYAESRFHEDAIRVNQCGSIDIGGMQVNSVHWFSVSKRSEWFRFCRMYGVSPDDINNLWNPEVNTAFAALLNEDFIQTRRRTYGYYRNPDQRKFYDRMVRALRFDSLAAKYPDSQYQPGWWSSGGTGNPGLGAPTPELSHGREGVRTDVKPALGTPSGAGP